MADPPPYPDTGEDTGVEPDRGASTGMARWQKVVGIIGLVVVAGVGVLMFGPDRGGHGPGMHEFGGDDEGAAPRIDGAPELAITADELAFSPDRIELTSGKPVNVALTSTDLLHDLVVDEIDFHLAADRGATALGGMVFEEPSTYFGYCSVPGHRVAGMELEIVVTRSGGSN